MRKAIFTFCMVIAGLCYADNYTDCLENCKERFDACGGTKEKCGWDIYNCTGSCK